jgi:hypothetical protein
MEKVIISDCNKYRYSLWRIWDKEKPIFTFIGLNPQQQIILKMIELSLVVSTLLKVGVVVALYG